MRGRVSVYVIRHLNRFGHWVGGYERPFPTSEQLGNKSTASSRSCLGNTLKWLKLARKPHSSIQTFDHRLNRPIETLRNTDSRFTWSETCMEPPPPISARGRGWPVFCGNHSVTRYPLGSQIIAGATSITPALLRRSVSSHL